MGFVVEEICMLMVPVSYVLFQACISYTPTPNAQSCLYSILS